MVKGYLTGTVTRIQEGACMEDEDIYETAYLVYNPEGTLIWDTTHYECVEPYFDEINRDLKTIEEILQLTKTESNNIGYCRGCDKYGEYFSVMHYINGKRWIIYETHNVDSNKNNIISIAKAIENAWCLLS